MIFTKGNGPGGKFEVGETLEECVTRDVLEESVLVIKNSRLHGSLLFTNFKGNDWYVFVYTVREFTGELIDFPEGKLEWIPNEKLTSLNLWESDHISFPWIENKQFFSAKFEYDGDKMGAYEVIFHS